MTRGIFSRVNLGLSKAAQTYIKCTTRLGLSLSFYLPVFAPARGSVLHSCQKVTDPVTYFTIDNTIVGVNTGTITMNTLKTYDKQFLKSRVCTIV